MVVTLWPVAKGRRGTSLKIFGMLLGGAAGLALGGPIYGAIGAIGGHLFDRYRASTQRRARRRRDWSENAADNKWAKPIFD
ncbi:MAG: hypothetical protein ACR2QF_14710, partial [Geminicoccaceae bacterium]